MLTSLLISAGSTVGERNAQRSLLDPFLRPDEPLRELAPCDEEPERPLALCAEPPDRPLLPPRDDALRLLLLSSIDEEPRLPD